MNTYVVAIYSFLENEIKQFIIKADSDYNALKQGLIEFAKPEYKEGEINFQNSEDYPKTIQELISYQINADMSISIIKI